MPGDYAARVTEEEREHRLEEDQRDIATTAAIM